MRGLLNCGNTCYFNTAIQCLAHCPQLSNHLMKNPYTGDCRLTQEYRKVVKELFAKNVTGSVDPRPLIAAFRAVFSDFNNHDQHDSQEVIIKLIDHFENTLGKEFIQDIFNGEETTETTCPSGTSKYTSSFVSLMFPLEGGTVTLEELVNNKNNFQKILEYKDASGVVHPEAETRTTVTKWPSIISFTFGMYGPRTVVKIPQQFMNKNLFAVVVHNGGTLGGHYRLAVKRHDVWYLKDDDSVVKLSEPPMRGHFYMAWYR